MDTMKDTTMQHVTDVTIVPEATAELIAGLIARIEQLESDLATAEQDSRQKQARIDRLEAAEKDIALKEKIIDSLGAELNAVANEREACAKVCERLTKPSGPVPGHPIDAWLLATLDCAKVIRARGE